MKVLAYSMKLMPPITIMLLLSLVLIIPQASDHLDIAQGYAYEFKLNGKIYFLKQLQWVTLIALVIAFCVGCVSALGYGMALQIRKLDKGGEE